MGPLFILNCKKSKTRRTNLCLSLYFCIRQRLCNVSNQNFPAIKHFWSWFLLHRVCGFFIKNKDSVVELLDTFDMLFGIKMNFSLFFFLCGLNCLSLESENQNVLWCHYSYKKNSVRQVFQKSSNQDWNCFILLKEKRQLILEGRIVVFKSLENF